MYSNGYASLSKTRNDIINLINFSWLQRNAEVACTVWYRNFSRNCHKSVRMLWEMLLQLLCFKVFIKVAGGFTPEEDLTGLPKSGGVINGFGPSDESDFASAPEKIF